jgi:flagellar biosynthesis GTPase FlhF
MVINGGRMISDGGGGSGGPSRATLAAAALRKLQSSGANSLTNAERSLLGMAPKGATPPAPQASNNNAARDQAARDQAARDQAARDQAARDQAAAQAAAEQAAREQAAREAAAREAARREAERLEALRKAAEEARIAAIVAARPTVPRYSSTISVEPVKYASPADVLIQESSLPVDLILKQTLEKIGGLELISLVRHDTVNGQDIAYQPVKNLSQIELLYNPQNMVKIPDSSELYFKNFAIKLESHTPQDTNSSPAKTVYLDSQGRIVIDVFGLKPDYEVEIQTVSLGKVFGGTIYDEDES